MKYNNIRQLNLIKLKTITNNNLHKLTMRRRTAALHYKCASTHNTRALSTIDHYRRNGGTGVIDAVRNFSITSGTGRVHLCQFNLKHNVMVLLSYY